MKAIVYRGPYDVAVEHRREATIEGALDAIVRITTTNICGSDLHMYEGRTSVERGKILGHENMGVVEAVGDGLTRIKVGDRVSVPFNSACGTCRNCTAGWTSFSTLDRTTEARRSSCGSPSPTSTCSSCHPAPSWRATSRS